MSCYKTSLHSVHAMFSTVFTRKKVCGAIQMNGVSMNYTILHVARVYHPWLVAQQVNSHVLPPPCTLD